MAATILCLPAASFALYYLHVIREPPGFVEFRSRPGVELLAAAWGLLGGLLERDPPAWGRTLSGKRPGLRLSLALAFVPFAKPILLPVGLGAPFRDSWEGGVCLQSTMATCGPCSLATVMRSLGLPAGEKEIARGAFSAMTGTENWYLLRYARRRGLRARVVHVAGVEEVKAPAILGVRLGGGVGHFIVLLGREHGRLAVGDPLSGKVLLDGPGFAGLYGFTGAAMEFGPP